MPEKSTDASEKLYAALTASASRLLVAMVTLTIAYTFIAASERQRIQGLQALPIVDKLLAVREVATRGVSNSAPFLKSDLPKFFEGAAEESRRSEPNGIDPSYYEVQAQRGFSDDAVAGSFSGTIASRLHQMKCRVALVNLAPGERFSLVTYQIVGKVYLVNSQDVSLVILDSCLSSPGFGEWFLLFRSGGDLVVGVPASIVKAFPGLALPRPMVSFPFHDNHLLGARIPVEMRRYADFTKDIVPLHMDAIEYYMIRHASARYGRFYSPGEFDVAISRLFDEKEQSASLLGINASIAHLLVLGPFFLFVLTFDLWRRVAKISPIPNRSVFWFATDTSDCVGIAAARVCSLTPLVSLAVVYFLFCAAISVGIASLKDMKVFLAVSRMSSAVAWEWLPISVAPTMLMILVPVHLYLAARVSVTLFSLINASCRLPGKSSWSDRYGSIRTVTSRPMRRL